MNKQFFGDKPEPELNVFGEPLQPCSLNPLTGFYRTGHCITGPDGTARHTVCIEATAEFLAFSASRGNDLSTPMPQYAFPGLKPGDRWCVCAGRWKEAVDAGAGAPVFLKATHEKALELIPFEDLIRFAADGPETMQ